MGDREEKRGQFKELKSRLQWLMFLRVIIASFFLGVVVITQLQKSDSYLGYIYGLIGSVYFFTFIYVFILAVIKNFRGFACFQIFIDVVFITALIFITGGINSLFPFMYSIAIISASILFYIVGGTMTATLSAISYSTLICLQHYGLISPFQTGSLIAVGYAESPLYFPIIVNVSTFYLIAFLSSFLAEQARKSRALLKEKQIDIENLEALNENVIQSINSGLLTLDNSGRIITFNRAAQDITGLLHSQVYMKHSADIFAGITLPEHADVKVKDNQFTSSRFETSFLRHDGKVLYLGFSLSNLKDKSGHTAGQIIVFQDLTGLKEMQENIQRMDRLAAVGRLAAGIAHEVRNPLASISGSIQVLQKSLELNDADKRLMNIIIKESNNLSELISEFTQFARPGKQLKERLNIKQVVGEVVEIFKNSPECREVIKINQSIKENIFVFANHKEFKQVLWNLVINAAQAVNDASGEISLSARVMEKGFHPGVRPGAFSGKARDSWVEIQINDTGYGIKKEDLDKIFDPFYTTKENGTGLGLSIAYKIIQDHDGIITADSMQGQGTSFIIYLPQQSDNSQQVQ